jgi:hypothetical protein
MKRIAMGAAISLVTLVVAVVVLSMAQNALAGAPRTAAEEVAVGVARNALDHAIRVGSEDLIPKPALRTALVDEVFMVHDPETLAPVYGLVPIQSPEGRLLGTIGVTPDGEKWLWYNFNCPYEKFPPVSMEESRRRLGEKRSGLGLQATLGEPIIVAGCDKHLYWRFQASPSESWLINAVVPGAPILGSIDQSDTKALTPEKPLQAPDSEWMRLHRIEQKQALPGEMTDQSDLMAGTPPACYSIPGIPYHFQITDWYCGPASLQMIMDYYGQEIGQNNIADVANDVVNSGCMGTDMRRAAHFSGMSVCIQDPTLIGYTERKLGYACIDNTIQTNQATRVKNTVYAQYAVYTLTWYDGSHSAGHFRVIKGYDDSLGVFIIHDPWYAGALCGPDLLVSQTYFVDNLWAYSGWWCMVASPWVLTPSLPTSVAQGDTFQVALQVYYPGPTRFKAMFPCSNCQASISLSAGLALAGGTPMVVLPNMDSDDTVNVVWNVIAVGPAGDWGMAFQAQGLLQSSSYSYPSYTDTIGGHAYETVMVGGMLSGWEAEERLTNDTGSSQTCFPGARAMVIGEDGKIHVVWADTRDTNSEIYYQRKVGGAWESAARLTTDPSFSDAPCIAQGPDGSLHVAWVDERDGNQEIYYKRWNPIGGWSADECVTSYSEVDRNPSIAVGDSLVYLVWERRLGGSYRVAAVEFAARGGAGWSAPVDVDGSPTRDSYRPSIAVGPDGLVHVVYERQTSNTANEKEKILHKSWNGLGWSAATGLSSGISFARNPSIAVGSDSTVHVVWQDGESIGGDIFYDCYRAGVWQPAEQIVIGSSEVSTPSVAVAGAGALAGTGTVYVAWVDNRNGESEIYLMSKGGSGWDSETRLTRSPGASILPTVAADDLGGVCLVWTDLRNGDADVYFRGAEDESAVPWRFAGSAGDGLVRLSNPYPMPFTSETRIGLSLGKASEVSVQVFDVQGQLVQTLVSGNRAAGTYDVLWDGRTSLGGGAAPGLYFVACRSPIGQSTRPVVLLK